MLAEAPKVDAKRLPDFDWSALCHVSCSALLGGAAREPGRADPLLLARRLFRVGDEETPDERPCDRFEPLARQLDVDWAEDRILASPAIESRGVLDMKMNVREVRVSRVPAQAQPLSSANAIARFHGHRAPFQMSEKHKQALLRLDDDVIAGRPQGILGTQRVVGQVVNDGHDDSSCRCEHDLTPREEVFDPGGLAPSQLAPLGPPTFAKSMPYA